VVGDAASVGVAGEGSAEQHPSSLARIQRLERLERERLEEKDRRDTRRRERLAAAAPSGGRHDLVDRIEHVTKYPLVLIAVAWVVIAVVELATDVSSSASTVLVATLFALWVILLVEYVVRLVVTPDRPGYLRRRWVEPATVAVPPFQVWHFIGIEKVSLLALEARLQVAAILQHHSLFRVLIAAAGSLFVGAWLVLLFEDRAKSSNIHNYPSALWWAIVTVTTVGYGDRYPVSGGGRTVATVLMLLGIGLIGVLTATVASFFVKQHTDANKDAIQQGHATIAQELAVITSRLGDLERRLGATTDEVAAADAQAEAGAPPDLDPGPSTA
jgi:voltage-gated potassium channel